MIAGVHLARRDEQPADDARIAGPGQPAEREEALV
jgi:hypothetical protein